MKDSPLQIQRTLYIYWNCQRMSVSVCSSAKTRGIDEENQRPFFSLSLEAGKAYKNLIRDRSFNLDHTPHIPDNKQETAVDLNYKLLFFLTFKQENWKMK